MRTGGHLAGVALSRTLPAAAILSHDIHPQALRARFDGACDELLKLDRRARILKLEDYRAALDRMARAVAPLFCGVGSRVERLLLLPPHLLHAYKPDGYEKSIGADEEVVFLAVQGGITLQSIANSEERGNEQVSSCAAPPRD